MTALRFRGPVLPDGESRTLYVVDGRVTYERTGRRRHRGRGLDRPGPGRRPLPPRPRRRRSDLRRGDRGAGARRTATRGALLIRDCGSAADTAWIHDRDDLPRLIRAGRHIARTKRYIRNYAHEVEPDELTEYVAREAQRGDGWVKLVGDWISREEGDLAPSFPPEAFAAAIATAHEHGARVTAHCFGEAVLPGLIEAGIDCIEHGTGLSQDLIDTMVEKRIALVPTVMQIDKFPRVRRAGRRPSSRRTPRT